MILAIIPARGGSKGLPGKHLKRLAGKPVIQYTIEAARNSKCFDKVVVSSDSDEILSVAKSLGSDVLKRPSELATDQSNIDDVLKHVVETYDRFNTPPSIVVWLQPNVPIRHPKHIKLIVNKLLTTNADSVLSISPVRFPIEKAMRCDNDRLSPFFDDIAEKMNRQQYRSSYVTNGSVYAIRRETLMKEKAPGDPYDYFFGREKKGYIIEDPKYGIEINDAFDYHLCEFLFTQESDE
jgi:CMP-N,N'-diacetyllegionaminic acid synthase